MSNYRERFFIHIEYFLHIAFVITTAREADSKKCVRWIIDFDNVLVHMRR